MRRGILGTIVALVTGAGVAWGQAPMPIAKAGGVPPAVMAGDIIQADGPAPVIMPPLSVGPPNDPMGLGPTAGLGQPPGPMYPMPGPYAEPLFQPPPSNEGGYGSVPRWEVWGNYSLWFNKSMAVPIPLLTTGAPNQGGVLGASSTLVLSGGGTFNYGALNGMQLGGSFWGDEDRRFGMYVDGFYTANKTISQKFAMTGNGPGGQGSADLPILSRPYFDSTFGNTSLILGGPGTGISSAVVSTSSQTWGVEASGMWNLYRTAPSEKWFLSLDAMLGYKFTELRETLSVSSVTTINGTTSTPVFTINPATGFPILSGISTTPIFVPVGGVFVSSPGQIAISDRFTTTNLFNGTTFALRGEARYGMFSLEAIGKIGLGDMHQIVDIAGFTYVQNTTTTTVPGNLGTAYGGLLANASNIGRFQHDDFSFIPEATLNVGINLTRSLSAFVGYNFMYMTHVVRPGDQVSPNVDSTTVPLSVRYGNINSTPAPTITFNQTSYYLMGVNFGMAFKY
ncbi:MAG TPA: BBP7 family outer membrane beta-barrel protein [Gemmata sp.]|nr:BBP7 family outer membrane beta-barrel protein [Gemmata sp.]